MSGNSFRLNMHSSIKILNSSRNHGANLMTRNWSPSPEDFLLRTACFILSFDNNSIKTYPRKSLVG